jgi:hypothetical protein
MREFVCDRHPGSLELNVLGIRMIGCGSANSSRPVGVSRKLGRESDNGDLRLGLNPAKTTFKMSHSHSTLIGPRTRE